MILFTVLFLGIAAGLLALASNPRVLGAAVVVWYIILKLCWLHLQIAETGVIGACCFLSIMLFISLAQAVF